MATVNKKLLMLATSSQKRIFVSDQPTESIVGLFGAKNDILSFCIGYKVDAAPDANGRTPTCLFP